MSTRQLIFLSVLVVSTSATAGDFSGKVREVLNQNVFVLDDPAIKVQLCGVSYRPEGSPDYEASIQFLSDTVGTNVVTCRPEGQGTPCDGRFGEKYEDKVIAQCFADGHDIAELIIRAGFSCALVQYSQWYYAEHAKCVSRNW